MSFRAACLAQAIAFSLAWLPAGALAQQPSADRVTPTIHSTIPPAELNAIRRATERFRDLKGALAAGYIHDPGMMCVTAEMVGQPRELGAMGIHLFHPELLGIVLPPPEGQRLTGMDNVLDWSKPEVLVYEPRPDGSADLVAVEYLVFESAWAAAGRGKPPTLFGTPFVRMADDPATQVDESHMLEPHYELHLWLYRDNPKGLLAEFNPRVTCRHHNAGAATRDAGVRGGTLLDGDRTLPEVSTGELAAIIDARRTPVIDVRSALDFARGHIPGAIHLGLKGGQRGGTELTPHEHAVAIGRLQRGDWSRPIVLYCDGIFCDAGRQVGRELLASGYSDVRRYQLGFSVWRALGGLIEIESDGVKEALRVGAILVDARDPIDFATGSVSGARNIPLADVRAAHKNGRLPADQRGMRIIVFGSKDTEARAVAEAILRLSFHDVAYYGGTYASLREGLIR